MEIFGVYISLYMSELEYVYITDIKIRIEYICSNFNKLYISHVYYLQDVSFNLVYYIYYIQCFQDVSLTLLGLLHKRTHLILPAGRW